MPSYKLTYFNLEGRAECIRFVLSYAGKDFEDNRIQFGPAWIELKEKTPFGKVPVLEIDGTMYSDSASICRFLANECGLAGNNPLENLKIDQIVGAIQDLQAECAGVWKAEASQKEKLTEKLVNETLPFYLSRLDKTIKGNNGYLANGKLSWADLYFTTFCVVPEKMFKFSISSYKNIAELTEKVKSHPGIKAWLEKRPKSM